MRIEFHTAALQEIIDYARYYENKLQGLGADFTSELHRLLALLNENPEIDAVLEASYRRLLFDRFPFVLIYRTKGATLRILAVAHQRRKPGYWKGRK